MSRILSTAGSRRFRWWLDVDLVEQVEDGLITATTRVSYVNLILRHVIEPLGAVRLGEPTSAHIRE